MIYPQDIKEKIESDFADKDIEKLKKNLESATYDPRDVMLWAEYSESNIEKSPKRIRDFNKPFD